MSFWKEQPVEVCSKRKPSVGIIEGNTTKDVPEDAVPLKEDNLFLSEIRESEESYKELETFLQEHYVEDDEGKFRLLYSANFIKWFCNIKDKKGQSSWKFGIRDANMNLIAFIAAIPKYVSIAGKNKKVAEVNLMCVHSEHRKKKLAPYLIKEITRRINKDGISVAIHTSARQLPTPSFATARYSHALLDVPFLVDCSFVQFDEVVNGTLESFTKAYQHKVPKQVKEEFLDVYRPATENDIGEIVNLVRNETLTGQYVLYETIDQHFVKQYLLGCPIFSTFIVERIDLVEQKRKVCGFISFYKLQTLCVKSGKNIDVSYVYYWSGEVHNAVNGVFSYLKKSGTHVIHCLSTAKNDELVKSTRMVSGSGTLNYYMYNFRLPQLGSERVMYIVF